MTPTTALRVPRGADYHLRLLAPPNTDFFAYLATFTVYYGYGGPQLLALNAQPNANGSGISIQTSYIDITVKAADIAALPIATDPTQPSYLAYEIVLTAGGVSAKASGGPFAVLPLGAGGATDFLPMVIQCGTLKAIQDSGGGDPVAGLAAETVARIAADAALQARITSNAVLAQNSANALQAQISAIQQPVSPLTYGAIGDGSSHPASEFYETLDALQAVYPFATDLSQEMDWLGWQAAINQGNEVRVVKYYHFVMCNSNPASMQPLIFISGTCDLYADYSDFDWSAMTLKVDNTQHVSDPGFALSSGTPWSNATIYTPDKIIDAVFGGGYAYCFDPDTPNSSQSRFYQFGQQVTLPPGRYTASATMSAWLGNSFNTGDSQPAYAGIYFQSSGVGQGGSPFGSVSASFQLSQIYTATQSAPLTQTCTFDFLVTEETTCYFIFSGGGYLSCHVTQMSITPWVANCAVLMTRDGANQHYPVARGWRRFNAYGPGNIPGTRGFLWKSFSNTDGTDSDCSDCSITDFGDGMAFGSGAYLIEFFNVAFGSGGNAITSLVGSINAGENIRFYGGGGGSGTALLNNPAGMEFTFYGSALDYSDQIIINNAGRVELHGCHVETEIPTDPTKPTFELIGSGSIHMFGGMFLGAGGVNTSPCAPISTASSLSIFEVTGTQLYNLTSAPSAGGVAMSGPGQMRINSWLNTGNSNLGPTLLSRALSMDAMGGAGTFDPAVGTWVFNANDGLDPSGVQLEGGVFIDFTHSGDAVTGQWNSSRLICSVSTDYALTGTQSLKVQKLSPYGVGDGCRLTLLIPAKAGHAIIGKMSFYFPQNLGGAAGTQVPIYYRGFYVRVLREDQYGRPVFAQQSVFLGESDIDVPADGTSAALGWVNRSLPSLYLGTGVTDPTQGVANGAPAWATHYAILLDLESIPALTFYIDDFVANQV